MIYGEGVAMYRNVFRDVKSRSLAQTIDVSEKPEDEDKSRKTKVKRYSASFYLKENTAHLYMKDITDNAV